MASTAADLLYLAAHTDPSAAAQWERLARGLEALFPGRGACVVAHARGLGLDPSKVQRIEYPTPELPSAVVFFAPDARGRRAAATEYTAMFLGARS